MLSIPMPQSKHFELDNDGIYAVTESTIELQSHDEIKFTTFNYTRKVIIKSILSLDKRFTVEYLNGLTIEALQDLEDSILATLYEN